MKEVRAGKLVIRCENAIEEWRAKGFFSKEPGTVAWLKAEVKPGDVFYDIGANIGLYSLLAASLGATVYAFEPHVASAASLIRQVAANGLADKITLLTMALDSCEGLQPFHYASKVAGSSGSQFGHTKKESGDDFVPIATELKLAAAVDRLAGDQLIPAPDLAKIDVDGNELAILHGMEQTLRSWSPRSVQVEVHPADHDQIVNFMTECGYPTAQRHDTEAGAKRIAAGADIATVTHNLIFRRSAE